MKRQLQINDTILRMNVLKTTDGVFSCCNAINMQFLLGVQKKQKKMCGVEENWPWGSQKLAIHFLSHSDNFSQKYKPKQHVDSVGVKKIKSENLKWLGSPAV
jgi:hypothetical protein